MGLEPQIVVVGGAEEARVEALTELGRAGFSRVTSGETVTIAASHLDAPDLLVITGNDVRALVEQAREVPPLALVPILALIPAIPADEATAVLAAGATDVVVKPVQTAVLGARARVLLRAGASKVEAALMARLNRSMRRVQKLLSANQGPEGLRAALGVVCDVLRFDRASIIAHIEGSSNAYVIAATDDPTMSKFTLRVDDYPEMCEAMRRRDPVLIPDALASPITVSIADRLADKKVRAVAVFPILSGARTLGVVLMRRERPGLDDVDERFVDLGALFGLQLGAHLGHGRIIQSLKEQTGRISRARYEAERRLRMIDSLKEHFEASADGQVVLDEDGRILFVNNAAERITGFARDGLLGTPLVDLVPSMQADALQQVLASVLSGTNLEAFDLDLATTAGAPICVSVTTSTVLAASGAVILSFRDVTAQRALETELTKTKDFLEKLIDSTVDAIVAADIHGTVILFNQGAERIYGYSADDVVGSMPVWKLYPDGVANQVMRMLRSVSYGGVGRLEQTRREIVNRNGELVPVNMTASIIYEDNQEVATVGIFSDLRERIRIEQRLLRAQEKLQMTEKQALVAKFAGTAAHELNQPLTSIIGYSQLIERQSEPDAQHLRAVNVILREADRMADIVKKIGRFTRFVDREYVGDATIFDLDKSAAASDPELVIPDPEPEPSDDTTSSHDGLLDGVSPIGDVDDEPTKVARLRGEKKGEYEEPTVVGHRSRMLSHADGDLDGDETLDEIDLEQALSSVAQGKEESS